MQTPITPAAGEKSIRRFALASMALGIVSICFLSTVILGFMCSSLALLFGHLAHRPPKPAPGYAAAGMICGGLGLAASLLILCAGFFGMALMFEDPQLFQQTKEWMGNPAYADALTQLEEFASWLRSQP